MHRLRHNTVRTAAVASGLAAATATDPGHPGGPGRCRQHDDHDEHRRPRCDGAVQRRLESRRPATACTSPRSPSRTEPSSTCPVTPARPRAPRHWSSRTRNLTEHMSAPRGRVDWIREGERSGTPACHRADRGRVEKSTRINGCRSRPRTRASVSSVGGLLSSQVATELEIGGPYSYGKAVAVAGQQTTAIKGSVATQNGGKVPVVLYIPGERHAAPAPGSDQRRRHRQLLGHSRRS